MPSLGEARRRHASYYGAFVQANAGVFDALDPSFEQIQAALSWLIQQTDTHHAQALLSLIKALAPYLQERGQHVELLRYCENAQEAARRLNIDPGWLYLLKYEALSALGRWEEALTTVQNAIETTRNTEPATYARAVLALGRLQLNRGQYREALKTLDVAEAALRKADDYEGLYVAKGEVAAYHLNRDDYQKALELYVEADEVWAQAHPDVPSKHTLLMLGVVYRKLKDYENAKQSLNQLIEHSEAQQAPESVATGKHHLAWIHCDMREWAQAKKLVLEAKQLYETLRNPRGLSDVEEQLGVISFAERDFATAEAYLQHALKLRRELGNRHGTATSLRRLAKLYLVQKRFLLSLQYLWECLMLYRQLDVLSFRHLFGIVRYLFERTV